MGKVRAEIVKKMARELVKKYPSRFTGNFESDKEAVKELLLTRSKRLRNRIAGYTTRLKVTEMTRAAATEAAGEEELPEDTSG